MIFYFAIIKFSNRSAAVSKVVAQLGSAKQLFFEFAHGAVYTACGSGAVNDLLEQFIFSSNEILAAVAIFLLIACFVSIIFDRVVLLSGEFVWDVGSDINQDNIIAFLKAWIIFTSVFCVVLFSNVCGLLPYSLTLTSALSAPFFIGLLLFFYCFYTLYEGRCAFLSAGFLPAGSDLAVAPLLAAVEGISYAAKFISLSVRLFANMFAGHLLLKVFYTLSFQVALAASAFYTIVEFCSFSFASSVVSLEVMIAVLQAFVVLLLGTLYFKETQSFVSAH